MFRSFPAPKAVLICYFVTVVWFHFFFIFKHSIQLEFISSQGWVCVCVYKGRPGARPEPSGLLLPCGRMVEWQRVLSAGRLVTTGRFTEDWGAGGSCANWALLAPGWGWFWCRLANLLLTGAFWQSSFWALRGWFSSCVRWGSGCLYLAHGHPSLSAYGDFFTSVVSLRSSLFLVVPTSYPPSLGLSCIVIRVHVLDCSGFPP